MTKRFIAKPIKNYSSDGDYKVYYTDDLVRERKERDEELAKEKTRADELETKLDTVEIERDYFHEQFGETVRERNKHIRSLEKAEAKLEKIREDCQEVLDCKREYTEFESGLRVHSKDIIRIINEPKEAKG